MDACIYIGHPAPRYLGDVASVVRDFMTLAPTARACGDWQVHTLAYAANASLNSRDYCSRVIAKPGPVLLLAPIQGQTLEDIRGRLGGREIVSVVEVHDLIGLQAAIADLMAHHAAGEPLHALDKVIALLLLRKLDKEHMWTGNNDKGYMWFDDLPNGRGIDEKYRARLPHIVNVLYNQRLLLQKISRSSKKYGLNPDRKVEIYTALRNRAFSPHLEGILNRGAGTESARSLDVLSEYDNIEP
jgi:hypothetical protein